MLANDYSIKVRPITSWNPQAKAIFEKALQPIGNIQRTFKTQNMLLDDKSQIDRLLASTMFALTASTVHTTTQ